MIKAILYKDGSGIIHGFCVMGHAGFAKKGEDIVCSAVSIITINTINSIDTLTCEEINVTADDKNGIIKCELPERKMGKIDKQADLLLKSMILGLESIKKQYGKYIEILEERL